MDKSYPKMKLAIVGEMCSGKSTCAEHLAKTQGYINMKLADPIYWVVNGMEPGASPSDLYYKHIHPFIIPELSMKDQHKFISVINDTFAIPKESPKPRRRLQFLGTEGGRNQIRDTIWIDILLGRVDKCVINNISVDDVRFHNEKDYLKKAGFFVVKLNVARDIQVKRIKHLYGNFDFSILEHGSEVEIREIKGDTELDANKPLEEMLADLDEILKGAG